MLRKIILILVLFLSINFVYAAREGLSFSTTLNKLEDNGFADYSSGEKLDWNFKLNNNGPSFRTNVCFYLRYPNGIVDITNIIIHTANLQHYNCNDTIQRCPINLSNVEIGTTNQVIIGKILTYKFPSSGGGEGDYSLIAQFRDPNILCSNPDGSISSTVPIAESINYLKFRRTSSETELRTASILNVPIPNKFHCFLEENKDNLECSRYYKEECFDMTQCYKSPTCSRYYNPVCGTDGLFYPSACWAEQLGTQVAKYGYCDSLKQFIKDLWLTKKQFGSSYIVPSPDIEFTYLGSGIEGWKNGVWLRSTLWKNLIDYSMMDFNIKTTEGADMSTSTSDRTTTIPVLGSTIKGLLVFVMFDNAYPEQVLLDWTQTYKPLMNDYIKKKQKVPIPIQYDIIPVVINPPSGVEKISSTKTYFSEEETQKIYNAAVQKIGLQDFKVFIVSSIFIRGFGGSFGSWNNMQFIEAPVTPLAPYSETDKKTGLDALAAFQDTFITISHEILHATGLPGDHVPMGYGTQYLTATNQNIDYVTGKERVRTTPCDFLASSPDYYSVELPEALKIRVGDEPNELIKEESISGSCLVGLHNNEYLKDHDRDGEYEIMYANNIIGIELQRFLGWTDVDGDNIAELIDQNAYGGWKEIKDNQQINGIWRVTGDHIQSKFEPLEEININNCKFEKIRLEDGREGLVPLRCTEFNKYIVNIYKNVEYDWEFVQKEYGTILLPRLN